MYFLRYNNSAKNIIPISIYEMNPLYTAQIQSGANIVKNEAIALNNMKIPQAKVAFLVYFFTSDVIS